MVRRDSVSSPITDHVCQDLQSDRFHFSHSFVLAGAICHDARKVGNRSQETPVLFSLDFHANWFDFYHASVYPTLRQ